MANPPDRILFVFIILFILSACNAENSNYKEEIKKVRGGDLVATLDGSNLYQNIVGHGNLVVSANKTNVHLYVMGLNRNTNYAAHVHNGECDSGGGGHYLQDLDGEDVAANGIWPLLTTNDEGFAISEISQDFIVRDDAKSIVIHEPGSGTRIACADLESNPAHVHVESCDTLGGPHYLQNVGGEDIAMNGLWPKTNTDEFGNGMGWAQNAFTVRFAETLSIILHDPTSGERIACASLNSKKPVFLSGSFTSTPTGASLYGENTINGRALLHVNRSGQSMVEVTISGLNPNISYPAHVHNGTCPTGGGGHYLQDLKGEDVSQNGLWPKVTTNEYGIGTGKARNNFIIRNDARSVVIHEPVTKSRIACADLK